MISFKVIEYELNESSDSVFSRLTWAVKRVDSLNRQLLSNYTKQTSKDWIGALDEKSKQFALMEPSGILTFFPLQIILRGKILGVNEQSLIHVRFRLGWHTFMFYTIIYIASAFVIGLTITSGDIYEVWNGVVWLLFPILLTYLLFQRMKKIESKLDFLFSQNSSHKESE